MNLHNTTQCVSATSARESKPAAKNRHPSRPLFSMGIDTLETLFLQNRQNHTQLIVLQKELQHRSTARARRLRTQVEEQLNAGHAATAINASSMSHNAQAPRERLSDSPSSTCQQSEIQTLTERPAITNSPNDTHRSSVTALFIRLTHKAKQHLQRLFVRPPSPATLHSADASSKPTSDQHQATNNDSRVRATTNVDALEANTMDSALSPSFDNRSYAGLPGELHKQLAPQDHRILLGRAIQQQRFDEIGSTLNMSRQAARKRDSQLVAQLAEQHKRPLTYFANALDQFLDQNNDEATLSLVTETLQLSEARLKVLLHIAQPYLKTPCRYDENRVYRLVELLP